jgi:hypothetical protein
MALKKLTQKFNLTHKNSNNDLMIDQQTHHSSSITFSADFVKYYFGKKTHYLLKFSKFIW